eukprot:SAG31_NODE_136_length_23089_cov_8.825924_25_plen_336_part_00
MKVPSADGFQPPSLFEPAAVFVGNSCSCGTGTCTCGRYTVAKVRMNRAKIICQARSGRSQPQSLAINPKKPCTPSSRCMACCPSQHSLPRGASPSHSRHTTELLIRAADRNSGASNHSPRISCALHRSRKDGLSRSSRTSVAAPRAARSTASSIRSPRISCSLHRSRQDGLSRSSRTTAAAPQAARSSTASIRSPRISCALHRSRQDGLSRSSRTSVAAPRAARSTAASIRSPCNSYSVSSAYAPLLGNAPSHIHGTRLPLSRLASSKSVASGGSGSISHVACRSAAASRRRTAPVPVPVVVRGACRTCGGATCWPGLAGAYLVSPTARRMIYTY